MTESDFQFFCWVAIIGSAIGIAIMLYPKWREWREWREIKKRNRRWWGY